MKNAEIFGLTILGDGATVKRTPLINIIASGVYCPVAILAISDCTSHMAKGGMKDADYIANTLFLPHFESIDPNKTIIDLVAFDGAANVQKAGRILCEDYPKCTVIHGGEHVVSLVCGDICKLQVISHLIKINKLFYRFFTLHHSAYSMLLAESKKHNNGKPIMFIRASDTRMGGHIISLARTFRLKSTLESLITDPIFKSKNIGKKGIKTKIIQLIKSKSFWNHVLVCLKSLFPLLKLLRLCEKKEPAMDRLYYFVRKADSSLIKSKGDMNEMKKEFIARDPNMREEYYHISVSKGDIIEGRDFEYDDDSEEEEEGGDDGKIYDETDNLDSEANVDSILSADENGRDLGNQVINLWKKRRGHLVHSYSIIAWMLSPIPEVMSDAANNSIEHHLVVDELIDKLFHCENTDLIKNTFWEEYNDFSNKVGTNYSRDYIWNNQNLSQGKSYLWHKMFSEKYTKVLGRLACRVTSKIIGIGSVERIWGDVKHLKSGKRSHILGKTLEKQATIYGRSCVEVARIKRDLKRKDNIHQENLFFDDEDLAEILKIPSEALKKIFPRRRKFNDWKETWETSTKEKCPKLERDCCKNTVI